MAFGHPTTADSGMIEAMSRMLSKEHNANQILESKNYLYFFQDFTE